MRDESWEHEAKETLSHLMKIGVLIKGLDKGGFRDHLHAQEECMKLILDAFFVTAQLTGALTLVHITSCFSVSPCA